MGEVGRIKPNRLRSASIVLALTGGVGQLAIAFMGFAIGGPGVSVSLLVADAVLAIAGAVAMARWTKMGATSILLAGAGALVALFSTTLLEIGVAALLLGAAAVGFASRQA